MNTLTIIVGIITLISILNYCWLSLNMTIPDVHEKFYEQVRKELATSGVVSLILLLILTALIILK